MPRGIRVRPDCLEKVKTALVYKGYPRQIDLAVELGVAKDTVRKFLNGQCISIANFQEFCWKLELEFQEIADSGDRNQYTSGDRQPAYNKNFEAFHIIAEKIKKQSSKEIDVITISANNYDEFIKVDKICPEHESVIGDKSFFSAGGSGANTICGLSKLGKKTAIVGCVKDDPEGREIINFFDYFSVNRELLFIENSTAYPKTGSTQILVERFSGRRQILVKPGINNYLSEIIRANEERLKAVVAKVEKSKILHLTSFAGKAEMELQLTILEQIPRDNIIVSFTPGAIYATEGLNRLNRILAHTDIMFLYTQQLEQLLERSQEINELKEFKKNLSLEEKVNLFFDWRISREWSHPTLLVIKDYAKSKLNDAYKNRISIADNLGKSKSFFASTSGKFNKYDKPLIPEDTTGTGDALAAGFLYGILEGKDIKTCADFGFIMSLDASKQLGARSHLPDESLLYQFYKNTNRQ